MRPDKGKRISRDVGLPVKSAYCTASEHSVVQRYQEHGHVFSSCVGIEHDAMLVACYEQCTEIVGLAHSSRLSGDPRSYTYLQIFSSALVLKILRYPIAP